MRINEKILVVSFFLVLALSAFVSAFGVSSSYWEGNPLQLAPGNSATVVLKLQNIGGAGDLALKAKIINGSEITTITDSSLDYFVPLGDENVPANLEIRIPEDAPVGKMYKVSILFTEIPQTEGGMVQVASGVQKNFDVKVTGKSPEQLREEKTEQVKSLSIIFIPIIIFIVIIIIIILSIRKKK